jgi:hypothetical protein
MESDDSFSWSEETSTDPYPQPDESSQYHDTFFLQNKF